MKRRVDADAMYSYFRSLTFNGVHVVRAEDLDRMFPAVDPGENWDSSDFPERPCRRCGRTDRPQWEGVCNDDSCPVPDEERSTDPPPRNPSTAYTGTETKIAGFWRSDRNPDLPVPVVGEMVGREKAEFLQAMQRVEAMARSENYRGWSTCRVCGCQNGSSEFEYEEWRWPEGFRHYISAHGVRPPEGFIRMIKESGPPPPPPPPDNVWRTP